MPTTIRRAKANPTKAFFVRMLTRDISLTDCILDLIDNSIDSAWSESGATPTELIEDRALAPYHVAITINADTFQISDNCGGIDLDDATNYAFTFGRSDEEIDQAYSVGVYGIGMKRAVFKMGNAVSVVSTFDDEGIDAFEVPINVSKWLVDKTDPWDFELRQATPANETGVTITVGELFDDTVSLFEDPTYVRRLHKALARDYMVPLMRGLTISLNGENVVAKTINFANSSAFEPLRRSYEDNGVRIEIIAGMTSSPPDDVSPTEEREEDISGWYVLCNGRVVLAADRTDNTVWGSAVPKWHRQYAGFTGVVLFSSTDPMRLPMTTTKRSVDTSSAVYRRAIDKMARPTKEWIGYTNARKGDLEAARVLEQKVTSVPVISVAKSGGLKLPSPPKTKARSVANIAYSVDATRLRKLSAAMGDAGMTYRDVGIQSFEYAYDSFVQDEA
ncbi:ATP-binding protein [Plantibacter cousiniae (nom. nud.)]|uniref:ATP-binding protein n=1 Tax=Plantibacter cousiniae (nom. nud.) TaxID=199709 RepID=UPI001D8A0657|nr:ATP-binding protein [Plantibacter cousiniae]CAH0223983.1 hypothetical protein SRABI02_02513 [Plantibacter cousiniae]